MKQLTKHIKGGCVSRINFITVNIKQVLELILSHGLI